MTQAYLNRGCFDPSVSREGSSESLPTLASPSQAKLCPLLKLNRSLRTRNQQITRAKWSTAPGRVRERKGGPQYDYLQRGLDSGRGSRPTSEAGVQQRIHGPNDHL